MHKTRPYIYYDYTKSLCPECLETIDAKIVFRDEKVWMLKYCKKHGESEVMIADDVEYYKQIRNYNKQSEMPLKSIEFNFPIYRDGKEVRKVLWERGNTVETVCLLSRKAQ